MIPGWKLNPQWRLYFAMKQQERHARLRAQREYEEQMAALDKAADEILNAVVHDGKHQPRH